MSIGRNIPILLTCQGVEIVTKFSGCECGVMGLAREALVAMLAADLGLPVPEPVLVELPEGFIDAIPEDQEPVRAVMTRSVAPAFGSTRLPNGYAVWMSDRELNGRLLHQAAEIFAFDLLTLNADRIV